MKTLMKYLKNYKKESILAPLFKMLEASFELFVPLVMAAIIDRGIANTDKPFILSMGGVLIALGLIGLTCSITAQFFAAKAATGFAKELRHELFSHIQGLNYSRIDTLGTSTLITRMTSDVNQVQNGVNMVLRLFLRSPFIVIGAMIMAFYVDAKAALVFVVEIPVLAVVVFGIIFMNIPLYKKVQASLDQVLLATRENLNGIRVIRAFNKEEEEIANYNIKNQELTKIQLFAGRISALLNPVTYVIVNIALIVLLYVGAVRVDGGFITQGAVVALVNYMAQILVELVKLANLIVTITKAMACASRIETVLLVPEGMEESKLEDMKDTKNTSISTSEKSMKEKPAFVCFDHVSFSYEGAGAEALTDLSFQVKKGQTIGIIGGTGSGKSSLVNLIPRFYDVSKGRISIEEKDVRNMDIETLRHKVGIVPQKAALFQGTIAENIAFGKPDATEEELWEAITTAQAREFVEKKDGGLQSEVEQGGRNLSGGQKQRLTIARALVRKPEILILDDSCSALDYATDAALRKGLKEMENTPTVFLVSQRTSSIQYADQIIVMDDGEIAGIGTHDQLLDHCEVYREIYESQYHSAGKGGK